MMIIIIRTQGAFPLGWVFWGWALSFAVWWTSYLSPSFFPRMGRMGGKKLWERAWDDGLTGVFAYWERPLL
jgi:hypothetical protein